MECELAWANGKLRGKKKKTKRNLGTSWPESKDGTGSSREVTDEVVRKEMWLLMA